MPIAKLLYVTLFPIALVMCIGCEGEESQSLDCAGNACDQTNNGEELEPDTDIGGEREVWLPMQTHLHTTGRHYCSKNPLEYESLPEDEDCFSSQGMASILTDSLEYGVTDVLITDHNNLEVWYDPNFHPLLTDDGQLAVAPLRGVEWTTGSGHVNFFFPRQVIANNRHAIDLGLIWAAGNGGVESVEEYIEVIKTARDLGGLAIINHPDLIIRPFPDATYGADAAEILVPRLIQSIWQSQFGTLEWYHERLMEGDRITGLAGADYHATEGDMPLVDSPLFGDVLNLARVSRRDMEAFEAALEQTDDPEAIIDLRSDLIADAIRRGTIMTIQDLDSPCVYIGADLDGDGRYHDARAGDCIDLDRLPEGLTELRLRVRVTEFHDEDAKGGFKIGFWTSESDDEVVSVELDQEEGFEDDGAYRIDPTNRFAVTLNVPVDRRARGFFRVMIQKVNRFAADDVETATNPIYFGDWGDECRGSRPLLDE